VTRDVYPEVPPRVEYELTPLGRKFMQPVRGLVTWLQSKLADDPSGTAEIRATTADRKAS